MLHVYIAGPLGAPEGWEDNKRRACKAADWVIRQGHVPFVPHLSTAWVAATDDAAARGHEEWMDWCLAWVSRCDVVLRVPGESPGADREVAHAVALGIPVVDGRTIRLPLADSVKGLRRQWIREVEADG